MIGLGKNTRKIARICEKHFLKSYFLPPAENLDQFNRPRMTPRLKKGAIPTLFSFGPSPSPSRRKASVSENPKFDHSYHMETPPSTPVTVKPATTVNF